MINPVSESEELAIIDAASLAVVDQMPLERNPVAVYLASLSAGSRRTMRYALDTLADLLLEVELDALQIPWWELRYQHCAALRSRLAEHYSPASVNLFLSALRGVLREAWRLNLIPEEAFRRVIDVKGVRGQTLPSGRALTQGEIEALLRVCTADTSPAGTRDAAMIAVLYACGLRRAEVVGLDLEDWDPEENRLKVRSGKGRKDRSVPVANGAGAALGDWIRLRGDASGSLFTPIDKAGQLTIRKLTTQAVYNVLKKRAKQAGVKSVSPHDCRRTLISHLLDKGADLVTVSKIAGHASVNTTSRYDRRGEEAKRQAVELLHVPYCPSGS